MKANKIPYPLLLDPDGTVGRRYGAKTTPHVFVIHAGRLVYAGAFDNNRGRKETADYRGYVDEALAAVLSGKQPPITSTEPWGCSVKYKQRK